MNIVVWCGATDFVFLFFPIAAAADGAGGVQRLRAAEGRVSG